MASTRKQVIRERTEADLAALVEILAEVAAKDGYPSRWPDDPTGWIRATNVLGAWVAERDGKVLGQVTLRTPRLTQRPAVLWANALGREAMECAIISRLYIAPIGRGEGIGRALFAVACERADQLKLHPVLDVVGDNRAAIRLYEREGWVRLASYEETFVDGDPPELLHCYMRPVDTGPSQ